jgi:DNA gyrase/topoisomerase IV subunit B
MYTLFKAIGLGLDINNVMSSATTQEEAMELLRKNARYGKIIISTDADADGSIIASGLLYTFSRFARFMIDLGMVYLIESPIFSQDGKYFFPSDPTIDGEIPVGLNLKKHFRRYKGLGSLNSDEVYEAFYNPAKRRLIQVTPDGIDYAMSLVEDIQNRKNLLVSKGILGNPYGLFD